MPWWLSGIIIYLLIGVLLGEVYRYGCRKEGVAVEAHVYIAGVLAWWLALGFAIFGRGKHDDKKQ